MSALTICVSALTLSNGWPWECKRPAVDLPWTGSTSATGSAKAATKESIAAKRAVAMTVLEQSRQEVLAAMARRDDDRPLLARLVMVAPAARQAELRRRLLAVLKEIRRDFECDAGEETSGDHERWAVTLAFAPTARARA